MNKIKILDNITANQIAAGEVVERPVSVIKELIENSLDAGSTRVKITFSEGGLRQIRVIDDGVGMSYADLCLAINRHATSKIERVEDLDNLSTLGFRGEALPSIAAVSKLTITSRTTDSPVGHQIKVIDGTVVEHLEVGCPVGTVITVDDLFYNTPARKKFLKSPSLETGHISDMVGRIALSRPDISFELVQEERTILNTPGSGDLAQAVFTVLGGEVARNLLPVNNDREIKITGYISAPVLTRASRNYYHFFLNGRYIKNPELNSIVDEAYLTRIPLKRYPVTIIHLEMAPDLFDVNVHPAKLEVRFKDVSMVKQQLLDAINHTFLINAQKQVPELTSGYPKSVSNEIAIANDPFEYPEPYTEKSKLSQGEILPQVKEAVSALEFKMEPKPPVSPDYRSMLTEKAENIYAQLKPLGQLDGSYIIAIGAEGLYLIDQHAAHERIRYNRLKHDLLEMRSDVCSLAVPVTLELTHQQSLWLINNIIKLADWGYVLEHFGGNTFLIRGVPYWNQDGNAQEFLMLILEKIGNGSMDLLDIDTIRDYIALMACKGSVTANRYLTDADIRFLIQQLTETEEPFTCPHGRPIMIKLTREEIKKRFLRT